MRSIGRLDHRILALSAAALLLVLALAANAIFNLRKLQHAAEHHMRDARHAVLYAQFDVSLVRAGGETASFALTRREGFYQEAREALATGHAAIEAFRSSQGSGIREGLEAQHAGFLQRYRDLLVLVEQGLKGAHESAPNVDAAARAQLLDRIYAYEPLAATLLREVAAHREREYAVNEQAIGQAARRTVFATLGTLAVFALFILSLLAASRRQIVQPIERLASAAAAVAAGDRSQQVTVGGPEEVTRLQSAFNRMVVDLNSQEEDLRTSEQRLRAVLALREQVNRDLHDDVLQSIYAVGLTLEGVQRTAAAPGAASKLGEAIERLNTIMRNIRLYILQPSARLQDSQELVSALHALVQSAQGNQALKVDAAIDPGALPDLQEEHAHHLLQIAREALSNVQKHARAHNVAVTLQRHAQGARLTIRDDGRGFDTQARGTGGHGLRNMAARAELMGARVEIQSEPGQGTRVLLDLLPRAQSAHATSTQAARAQAA